MTNNCLKIQTDSSASTTGSKLDAIPKISQNAIGKTSICQKKVRMTMHKLLKSISNFTVFPCSSRLDNLMFIYCSQRRKNKADQSVGLTSVISSRKAAKDLVNSLAPPQSYDEGGEDNDEDNRPPRCTPKKSISAPKSPQPRRKSIVNANLPHAPGQLPGQKIGKKRSSLAPAHKQNAKMDVARAMGIMGFNSSRWLECSQVSDEK